MRNEDVKAHMKEMRNLNIYFLLGIIYPLRTLNMLKTLTIAMPLTRKLAPGLQGKRTSSKRMGRISVVG
jgi:hypothetical protein